MNLVINGTCAKGCSFCFTKEEARVKHTLGEMTIEKIDEIIEHYGLLDSPEEITILGGEPTQHSNFMGIIDHVLEKKVNINLVSNFLFGQKTLDFLIKNIKQIRWMFPNASELNEKNRIHVFKKNYIELYHAYSNTWGFEHNPRLYLSLTMSKDWKERDLYSYIKWLYHELDGKINAIRVGMDLTDTYLVNNKEMGNELVKILKFGKYNNIKITSDCMVPPCLFEGKNKDSVLENSLNFATFKIPEYDTVCGFMPLDVFPDGSSIHCYPLEDKVNIPNVLEISGKNNILELRDEFDRLYINNHKTDSLPQDCLDCHFYPKECNGICAGCLK
jgi:hypothetical protein